jgi:ribonuclease HI
MHTSSPPTKPTHFRVVCDGACIHGSGVGGWAAKVTRTKGGAAGGLLVSAGRAICSTEAELRAAILGLGLTPEFSRVTIELDRKDLVHCINNRSLLGKGSPRLTRCVGQLLSLCDSRLVRAVWVQGHKGHAEQHECDMIARQFARALAKQTRRHLA